MLLRHIVEHVKVQNWTSLVLEFFIVILGVFIGIQAANARERQATSIDRLHSEAEESVAYLHRVLRYFKRSAEARASVLQNAANGNVEGIEQEEMVLAINYLVFYPPVTRSKISITVA
jgi:hypothetical protein